MEKKAIVLEEEMTRSSTATRNNLVIVYYTTYQHSHIRMSELVLIDDLDVIESQ
jgi:hypothetical protein